MSAIRLARGFTGRDVIVKFAGCYHGHVDSLLVAGRLQRHDARRAEQPRRAEGLHRRHARAALQRRARAWPTPSPASGDEIAGVILEPVVGNMGLVDAVGGVPDRAAPADRTARGAADLRRGDDRLPPGLRRRAGAARADSRT